MRIPGPWNRSLRARLVAYFLILSGVTVAIVGAVVYARATDDLTRSVFERLEAVAEVKADSLDRWIDEQRRNVVFVGSIPGLGEQARVFLAEDATPAERDAARASLEQMLRVVIQQTADAQELMILDLDGTVRLSTFAEHEGRSQATEPFFTGGVSQSSVQNAYTSTLTGRPTITVANPLFDSDGRGRRVGVIAANLNLERIDRIVLERTGLGEGGATYLVGADNRFLHARLNEAGSEDGIRSEGIDLALAGGVGEALYEDYRGTPVIGVYRWLEEHGAALLVELPQAEAFVPAQQLALTIGVVGLISALLLAIGIWLVSLQVTRPIVSLAASATAVAGGDLTATSPVTSEDEVGRLTQAFNDMTAQLRGNVATLERRVEERTAELTSALDAQREAEERYRRLVEELPLAVYMDPPGDPLAASLYVSQPIEAMFGYPAASWLEEGFFESIVHPDDREGITEGGTYHHESSDRASGEYRIIASDGRVVWVRDDNALIRDDLGQPAYLLGFFVDVTAQHEAADARREAEERYRRLVEELPMVVYTDKPDTTATSEYISPRVEEIFGYPRERWQEEPFFATVLHPDDRERILSTSELDLSGADDRISSDYRVIAADGRTVWVHDEQWIVRDDLGAPTHLQGFMIDVTTQTEAQAEIRRQKQYFESLVEISPAAVVTMDRDERVTGWNPAATRLFGFTPEEAIGHRIETLILRTDEMRAEGQTLVDEAVTAGRASRITHRSRNDGATVDVEIVMVPLVVDGVHTGFYAVYHDITELQAARHEADMANQAKSSFLAAMSHEIRTPMNAIIGMSGLLLETPLNDDQRDFADTIRTSGDALLTIINDILDFSKIEAGHVDLEAESFDLRRAIESALDVLAPAAARKGIELAYQVDDDALLQVVGDKGRFRQIVLNLLSNAVKFTDVGEVELAVTARRLDLEATGGEAWEVSVDVHDTGIGIPADRMDRLFQSFSQADSSIARRFGGTGLGLAISRRLAEAMGGSLTAESPGVPGQGSTFHLRVVMAGSVAPEDVGRPESPVVLQGRRILVVDDNATNRRILVSQLGRWGIETRDTASPTEALDWIRDDGGFDLVLSDLRMPGMDGVALATAIAAASSPPPVVILSSVGERLAAGAPVASSLTKPVKPSALHDALVGVIAGPHLAQARTPDRPSDPASVPVRGLRILLAEDNAVNQKLAIRLLQRMGYTADIAGDGLAAIAALEREEYDVVLMDIQMPELDGLEATRRIRARWPDRALQIIAMTANAMAEDREACLAAGMDDYVSKPIHVEELAAALERAASAA